MIAVYTLLSVGMQLHLHYCCGQLSDFHFLPSDTCNHTSETNEDHCCKKENCCSFIHIDLRVEDSHQPSEIARFIPFDFSEPIVFCSPNIVRNDSSGIEFVENNSPPPNSKRYLLFGSLVLYA
jgi:hypothetical protein